MKTLLTFIIIIISNQINAQDYFDSLTCYGDKYSFIKIDSADYSKKISNDNITYYSYENKIPESENIRKHSDKVFRTGLNLRLSIVNGDSVILINRPKNGEGLATYEFIDYNNKIGYYIILETVWECYNIILVNRHNRQLYHIPAKMKIFDKRQQIVASYIDVVSGGSWIKAYKISADTLIPVYQIIDHNNKWLFYDGFIDNNNSLIVKCQISYDSKLFKYFKVIKN